MMSYNDDGEETWMWPICSSDENWQSRIDYDEMFEGAGVHEEEKSSSSTRAGECRVKRSRRNRKRYVVSVFPRIVKRDIRRHLPQMFVNAVNECDYALLRGFFTTFCFLPDFRFFDYRLTGDGSLRLEDSVPGMSDIDSLLMQMECNYQLAPDSSMSLFSADIRQYREDGEDHCEIVCYSSGQGLRLFDFANFSTTSVDNCQQIIREPFPVFCADLQATNMMSVMHKVPKKEPEPIQDICTIIMRLDAQNRITQLHFVEREPPKYVSWIPCAACYKAMLGGSGLDS